MPTNAPVSYTHLDVYKRQELMKAEDGFANLKTTRAIIDRFPEYKGLQIHITEFNSSYTCLLYTSGAKYFSAHRMIQFDMVCLEIFTPFR